MRWLLPALAILLPAPADDEQARALYSALRKKIESAETISVDFSLSMPFGAGRPAQSLTGSIQLKGRDRWSISLRAKDARRPELNDSMTILSDGRRVMAVGRTIERLDPRGTSVQLRRMLPDSFLCFVMMSSTKAAIEEIEPPKPEEIRDGGLETVDGVEARVLLYDLDIHGQKVSAKSWIDPTGPRLLRRELSLGRQEVKFSESFTQWAVNAPIADSAFTYASLRRLAVARAKQVARSIALYGTFTGRTPSSLDELVARPKDLPEGVIWPAGGFALGGSIPRDPWGRAFSLRNEGARQVVFSLGADGKAGGSGDDEDVQADVPFSLRMAIVGATPRLQTHYEARITLHLLVAAVKAYRETYGELPKKKADLFEKAEAETLWPEGGWLPGKKMPLDPWGEEFRLITDLQSARAQVQDPRARVLTFKMLTAEERAALEK